MTGGMAGPLIPGGSKGFCHPIFCRSAICRPTLFTNTLRACSCSACQSSLTRCHQSSGPRWMKRMKDDEWLRVEKQTLILRLLETKQTNLAAFTQWICLFGCIAGRHWKQTESEIDEMSRWVCHLVSFQPLSMVLCFWLAFSYDSAIIR